MLYKEDRLFVDRILESPELFGDCIDRFEGELFAYVRRRVKKPEDRQDILQDIYIKVYRYLRTYNEAYSLRTWVYMIARSVLYSFWRKKHIVTISFDSDDFKEVASVEDDDLFFEHKKLLRAFLSTLQKDDQDLITMIFFEEMTYEDVSDILKKPVGTLKNRVFRIKLKARNYIQHHGYEK